MKLRLSEAIRLGSMLKPQDHEYFRSYEGYSCALGAAADALGVPDRGENDWDFGYHALVCEYPHLAAEARCPACSRLRGAWRRWREHEYDLGDVITHLNDDHQWSRERIADWVATFESQVSRVLSPGEEEQTEQKARSLVAYGRTSRSDRG